MLPGDTRTIRFLRPDGSVFLEQTTTQGSSFFNASQWSYFANLPSSGAIGTWTTSWLQNGIELAHQTFTVSSAGAPEIRVEQGTQFIRDQRFTPIDFGTVAANAAAPVQSFTITNAGSAPLTLGAISLPSGYELETTPASTVQPGQTTALAVRLLTNTPGYYSGELRLITSDAHEPAFRIWLEGIVETPGTATLIPGFSVRSVAEGARLFANVRRTGSAANAVTVTLTTEASELIVPTTVTIPAGSAFVNFEVQTVQDFSVDGDQRVQLQASGAGLTVGRNEVLVEDVFVGQMIVTETNGSTSFTVSSTLPIGEYRVWVRAIDARGQATAWSIRNEFFIATQPTTTPTLVSTFDQTPTLRWEAVAGARKYEVWVRNEFTGADIHRISNIQLPEWTVPASLTSGPYRWWVRAFGDYGITGLWSFGRDLFVGGRPVLLNAVVGAGSSVTFNWTAVDGAFEYRFQIDRLDVAQSRVVRENSLFGTAWQTPFALSAGTYRAWVQAVSTSGAQSPWSRAIDFVVT